MDSIEAADGRDFRYTKHGRDWRVRVRQIHEFQPTTKTNGGEAVESVGLALAVTVALLDDEGNVARNEAGELRISDVHTVTFKYDLGKFDHEAELERIIDQQIDAAECHFNGKDQLRSFVARFQKGA